MEKQYDIKAKRNGKFWTFGNMKTNQWGNLSLGMKVSDELVELINANRGQWINFSVFEKTEKPVKYAEQDEPVIDDIADEVPF